MAKRKMYTNGIAYISESQYNKMKASNPGAVSSYWAVYLEDGGTRKAESSVVNTGGTSKKSFSGTSPSGSSTNPNRNIYDDVANTGNENLDDARRKLLDKLVGGYEKGYYANYDEYYGSGSSKKAIDEYAQKKNLYPSATNLYPSATYEDIIRQGAQDYFYGGGKGGQQTSAPYPTPEWKEPAPYVSPYSDKINALLKKLETYPEFDSSTIYESPEYLALQERTRQIADKTRRNTMADAAAMTGGIPSSYALAAAASAEGDIKGKLLDAVPALTESAYGRYMDKQLAEFNLLQKLEELDKEAYGRHYGERAWDRSIYESDRGYDYQIRQDLLDRLRSLESEKYQRAIDERDYDRRTYESDRAFNYQVERDGKMFEYQVTRDKILDNRWMKQFDYNEQQDILANALRERQITVAERNATLAQNKFEWEKDPTNPENMANPETIGALYASMFASENPEEWLKENAQYLTKDELKTLAGFLPKTSEMVEMMQILFPGGLR